MGRGKERGGRGKSERERHGAKTSLLVCDVVNKIDTQKTSGIHPNLGL